MIKLESTWPADSMVCRACLTKQLFGLSCRENGFDVKVFSHAPLVINSGTDFIDLSVPASCASETKGARYILTVYPPLLEPRDSSDRDI